jgi:hypothetical protein
MERIRTEGQGKRTQTRWLSFGINGLGAALMIVVLSMTAGLMVQRSASKAKPLSPGSGCLKRCSART